MPDGWRPPPPGKTPYQPDLFWQVYQHGSPSFVVQHLCGYHWTPENYAREAEKLAGWGFECLRSRRLPGGQFWELWYLPGLWAARGGLRDETDFPGGTEVAKAARAIRFLCKNASFGTLDVTAQRAAMTVE
jgi:hypothetical protein